MYTFGAHCRRRVVDGSFASSTARGHEGNEVQFDCWGRRSLLDFTRPIESSSLPMNADQARQYIADLDARAQHRSTPFGPGGSMRWRIFGSGEPLVLIHGGHGSWLHWIANIDALAAKRSLVVADLPGFGDSDDFPREAGAQAVADATLASLNALLGAEHPIDIAGFSFGGSIAARIAAKRGFVRRLATLGSAGSGTPERPRAELTRWLPLAGAAREAALRHNLYAHMLHGTPACSDALAYEAYTRAVIATRYRSRGEVQRIRLTDILESFREPVLFLWGELDVTATPQQVRDELERSGPQRSVELLPGAGHWIQCECAPAVNAELDRWFSA
jgi:pimeloyl-ACP methyl ester carboxylesterase